MKLNADTFIVVVTFNSVDFIEKCIKSITESDYKKWFLAVIDNNSSDGTLERICNLNNNDTDLNDENFKLIKLNKNIGFAAAVNYSVFNYLFKQNAPLAQNINFVVLVNPDLVLEKNSISNLVNVFKQNNKEGTKNLVKSAGVLGGIIYDYEKKYIQNAGGKLRDNFITCHLDKPQDKSCLYQADYVSGALLAVKMPYFKMLKGLDSGYRPLYFEELDFCLKLKRSGLLSLISPKVFARHFEGASVQKFSGNFYRHYHKNRIRCAILNIRFTDIFSKFLPAEIKWLKNEATNDQKNAIISAYFLNFLFFLYNLTVRFKNTVNILNFNRSQ